MGYVAGLRATLDLRAHSREITWISLLISYLFVLALAEFGSTWVAYLSLAVAVTAVATLHWAVTGRNILRAEDFRVRSMLPQVLMVLAVGLVALLVLMAAGVRREGTFTLTVLLTAIGVGATEEYAWRWVWAQTLPLGPIISSLFFAFAHPQVGAVWLTEGFTLPSLAFFAFALAFGLLMVLVIALREVGPRRMRRYFGLVAAAGLHVTANALASGLGLYVWGVRLSAF